MLRQFHSSHVQSYIQCQVVLFLRCALGGGLVRILRERCGLVGHGEQYLVQYIRAMLQPNASSQKDSKQSQTTFSTEATTAICFLEDLAR
eukprot:4720854-Pyramimonas_sp.AAC.1